MASFVFFMALPLMASFLCAEMAFFTGRYISKNLIKNDSRCFSLIKNLLISVLYIFLVIISLYFYNKRLLGYIIKFEIITAILLFLLLEFIDLIKLAFKRSVKNYAGKKTGVK